MNSPGDNVELGKPSLPSRGSRSGLRSEQTSSKETVLSKTDNVAPENACRPSKMLSSDSLGKSALNKKSHSVGMGADLSSYDVRKNRIIMTIAHYLLTYPRYSISLFILLATRSIPIPTWNSGVTQPWRAMQVVAQKESRAYLECTMHAFDGLQHQLNATASREKKRVELVQMSNADMIHDLDSVSKQCTNASATARQALASWQKLNKNYSVWQVNSSSCSADDRSLVESWLNIGALDAHTEVTSVWKKYRDASLASISHMADYAERRSIYDYNYFIGVKVQGIVDLLDNFPTASLSLTAYDLTTELQFEMRGLLDVFVRLQAQIELLYARLVAFHASIESFYVGYVDLYTRLQFARLYVRDFVPSSLGLPDFLDLSGIPTADLLLPQVFAVPSFGNLPNIELLISDTISRILILIARLIVLLVEEATDYIRAALLAIYEALRRLSILEDYDPPKYVGSQAGIQSIEEENEYLEEYSNDAQRMLIGAVDDINAGEAIDDPSSRPDRSPAQSQAPQLDDTSTSAFAYLNITLPKMYLPKLVSGLFRFLLYFQWLIELVIQLMRLLRVKRKYERNAMPDLPDIDMTRISDKEEEEKQKENAQAARRLMLQEAILRHLLTPWFFLAMVLVPLLLLGSLVWAPHVYSSCIKTRHGTFFAHNALTPSLVNRANSAGNAYHSRSERKCRNTQQLICHEMYGESDTLYQRDTVSIYTAKSQHNDALHNLDVLDRCIDVSSLNNAFDEACCGLLGYTDGDWSRSCLTQGECATMYDSGVSPFPYRPLREYIDDDYCGTPVTTWSLSNTSRFRCDVMDDICYSSPCQGADEEYIRHIAVECDCEIEVYLMQLCLLVLLSLYHAISVNLCCSLVFNGVKRLRWQSLKPDGIVLRTQVDAHGEFVRGGDAQERLQYIKKAMFRFEVVGYIQLVGGCILFTLWLVSFFWMRQRFAVY